MRNIILPALLLFLLMACSNQQTQNEPANRGTESSSEKPDPALDITSEKYERADSASAQTLYVPVYSHIYQLNSKKTFNLTATLSFRNIDLNRLITLKKVLYYDSAGNLVKNYLSEAETLKPLASTSFVVEEDDLRGGVGANFIVVWESEEPVSSPIVEAVMISTSQQQGISFVSKARILSQKK